MRSRCRPAQSLYQKSPPRREKRKMGKPRRKIRARKNAAVAPRLECLNLLRERPLSSKSRLRSCEPRHIEMSKEPAAGPVTLLSGRSGGKLPRRRKNAPSARAQAGSPAPLTADRCPASSTLRSNSADAAGPTLRRLRESRASGCGSCRAPRDPIYLPPAADP